MSTKKLLVFQHIEREHSSRIAEYADDRSIELDVIRLWEPYTIPDISLYDGLIILGGPMGVYEDFSSKEDELGAIRTHKGQVPMLGICLGAQLIAHALGADVYPNKKEDKHIKEVGHHTVALTDEGKESPLFKGFPSELTVLQWHGDTFDLPEGATLLATGPACCNQAYSIGNMYGVQFHFEMTLPLLKVIVEAEREWAKVDPELDVEKFFREVEEFEPVMKKQCYQLLDNFLSVS